MRGPKTRSTVGIRYSASTGLGVMAGSAKMARIVRVQEGHPHKNNRARERARFLCEDVLAGGWENMW